MLRKKNIVITVVFCIFVMCTQSSTVHRKNVQHDTTQYNDKSTSVFSFYDGRYDTARHNHKLLHQARDTLEFCGTFRSIKRLYGGNLILHSLNFVLRDKFEDFFTFVGDGDSLASDANWNDIAWRSFNLYGFNLWIDSIIVAKPAVVDSLLFVVQNIKNNKAIIKQIWNWCETYIVLENVYNYSDDAESCAEILFGMPEMYPVVKLFINTATQNSHSLSSSQQHYLPYEISNYLSALSDKERFSFYQSLFKRTRYDENKED